MNIILQYIKFSYYKLCIVNCNNNEINYEKIRLLDETLLNKILGLPGIRVNKNDDNIHYLLYLLCIYDKYNINLSDNILDKIIGIFDYDKIINEIVSEKIKDQHCKELFIRHMKSVYNDKNYNLYKSFETLLYDIISCKNNNSELQKSILTFSKNYETIKKEITMPYTYSTNNQNHSTKYIYRYIIIGKYLLNSIIYILLTYIFIIINNTKIIGE